MWLRHRVKGSKRAQLRALRWNVLLARLAAVSLLAGMEAGAGWPLFAQAVPQAVAAQNPSAGSAPVPAKPQLPPAAIPPQPGEESTALLQLANELKAELEKTTRDMLSVRAVHKAEEIEKLAHRMRSK